MGKKIPKVRNEKQTSKKSSSFFFPTCHQQLQPGDGLEAQKEKKETRVLRSYLEAGKKKKKKESVVLL